MTDEPRITIDHVRKAGLCARGIRAWASRHGLDYMDFLRHGILVSQVEAINDAFARRMVAFVRGEQS